MGEEEGADEVHLQLHVVGWAGRGGGKPLVDELGVSRLSRVGGEFGRGGGPEEEAVGGGAREGRREVGLGLQNDLKRGGGERGDESARRVDEELVGGGGLDLEG